MARTSKECHVLRVHKEQARRRLREERGACNIPHDHETIYAKENRPLMCLPLARRMIVVSESLCFPVCAIGVSTALGLDNCCNNW